MVYIVDVDSLPHVKLEESLEENWEIVPTVNAPPQPEQISVVKEEPSELQAAPDKQQRITLPRQVALEKRIL